MVVEKESNLLLMRAIRYAMLLAVLSVGLPALAFAHGDHAHATMASPSYSAPATVAPAVIQRDTISVGSSGLSSTTKTISKTSARLEFASAASLTRSCSGECCCPGMSNCGMGSCCYSSLAPAANGLEFSSSPDFVPHHHYRSTALVMILGLDRPPKKLI